MMIPRLTAGLLGATALVFWAARLHAAPITLNSGSTVEALAFDLEVDPQVENPVTGLPYTTPATTAEGTSSSTTTPNLSASGFGAIFSQSISDPFSATDGDIDIFFTANTPTTYSISGSMTVVGSNVEGKLFGYLYDQTASTYLYYSNPGFDDLNPPPVLSPATETEDSNSLALDSDGGPLTGTLTVGDSYEFYIAAEMENFNGGDPNLTGSGGITFGTPINPGGGSSVPLPRSTPAALWMLFPLAGVWVVRRREIGAPHSGQTPLT